ncbi:MAG TPA: hypothetical protein VN089_03095 [Duganella sp.]|nr:hypothetical protein [Duganella sp.]
MIEIIKAIIEPIAKAISVPELLKSHKDKKAHEIGTELFIMYASLNEILVVGRSIVSELESGTEWMSRKLKEGKPDECLYTNLEFLLSQQSSNILKLVASVKRLGLELQVIAPDVYVRLAPLLHGKLNAVACLLDSINRKYSKPKLVSTDIESIEHILAVGDECSAALTSYKPHETESMAHAVADHVIYQERNVFEQLIRQEEIEDVGSIPAHQYPVIRAYLDMRKPSATLDDIEALLLVFRKSLEANFSLRDILLKVGDHRASLSRPYMGF